MLISAECLSQIDREVQKVIERVAAQLYNPEYGLEAVFLVGKLATSSSSDAPLKMSTKEAVHKARQYGIKLSVEDRAVLDTLKATTNAWLASVQDDLNKRIRVAIVTAEEDYAHQLMVRDSKGVLRKSLWKDIKELALGALSFSVAHILEYFEASLDRFMQTELAKYFQKGQVADVKYEEEVYKMPRPQACPHCMRLHLNGDGSPKIYKLKDVSGNSNVGRKAAEWQ